MRVWRVRTGIPFIARYADSSSDGRLLGPDTGGFHESRRNFTLALHEAHELGVRHAHWLAPVFSDPLAQIRPGEKSNLATLASAIVGTSGSKVERRAVLTPSATSVRSRMWGRAREIGAKQ